ncbi:MAG TPA: CDP-alcohol phosphatidyltransferase family protein [Pyrinomonadaceae bacterium]|nr:CDP-alcohol phosphatidyltransferase family protein [Pyrinomonadaceae bacterium]
MKQQQRAYANIPNLVTLSRLLIGLAAAGLIYALDNPYRFKIAAYMLTLASVMDLFDGYLARRLGSVTRFGAVLDPLADKIVTNVFFCVLVDLGIFEWWFVGLALARDFAVQAGRIRAASSGLVIRTFRVSDARNIIQITAVAAGLFSLSPRTGYFSTVSGNVSLADLARMLFASGLALGYIGLVAFFVTFWRAKALPQESETILGHSQYRER